jgi:hypothetical protein
VTMTARDAVLAAARMGLRADCAEEGFAEIRSVSGVSFSDSELAQAVSDTVRERLLRDPVRLLPGHLQCFWQLELVDAADGRT